MIGWKILPIAAVDVLFAAFIGRMRMVISQLSVEGGPRRRRVYIVRWINLIGHDGVGRMKPL